MIYLDIETLDFFQDEHIKSLPRERQLEAMQFGVAVTINDINPVPTIWQRNQIVDLYNYLCWAGAEIVGWNINSFDIPVIVNNARRAGWNALEIEYETIQVVDLFDEIRQHTGRWYKLETIAQATLGHGKLADGQFAAEWLRSGNPDLVQKAIAYCVNDVKLVRSMHQHWLDAGAIMLPPRHERGEINLIRWWQLGGFEYVPDETQAVSTK